MTDVSLTLSSFENAGNDDDDDPAYEYREEPDEAEEEYYRNLIDWQAVRNDKKQKRITAFFKRIDGTVPELKELPRADWEFMLHTGRLYYYERAGARHWTRLETYHIHKLETVEVICRGQGKGSWCGLVIQKGCKLLWRGGLLEKCYIWSLVPSSVSFQHKSQRLSTD